VRAFSRLFFKRFKFIPSIFASRLHAYSRRQAGDPDSNYQANKYWPPVNGVDNALSDRALICACPPMEFWEQQAAE